MNNFKIKTETQENAFGKSYNLNEEFKMFKKGSIYEGVSVFITEISESGLWFKVNKSEKLFSVKNLMSKGTTITSGFYLIN